MLDRTKEPSTVNADAKPAPPAAAKPAPVPKRRSRLRASLMLGGIAVVAIGAFYVWLTGGRYVSTDDAYVRAGKLMVSTDVSGIVSDVDVKEGQQVAAGDVLFRVDPRQYEIALRNAQANLDQTRLTLESMKVDYQRMASDIAAAAATVENDQTTFDRYEVLVKDAAALSRATYDQARFTLQTDKAKLDSIKQQAAVLLAKLGGDADFAVERHPLYLQAQAALDEAKRQLDHATVRAPFSGTVTEVDNLQPGLYLVAATAALTNQGAVGLISNDDMWVEANVKETDLTYLKPGDTVDVTIDAYPDHRWTGTVGSIAPASGAEFSVLPAQNASGNWVKVVQRVPVRIQVNHQDNDPILRAGMSAYVEIDTGHSRRLRDIL
ncbi:membrane fusion protein (multidrug efflux system) [Ancylobacter sp. 3268]|uniref:HlyD family secretion protein n=1 Tax=Ancylobacter sp. 3268 TaxID=2817752 RepID=UPI002860C491|nr:HlyD family secretion protein [Ancylobacter sp. 3268]MDR6954356.1 membrane fusion protein (multidrug efflux system) [Ancylobacter sp. 3268]